MILSLSINIPQAAARCRDIHSKVTGVAVPTELVHLIDVRAGRIASHTQFTVPVTDYPARMARPAPLD